MKESNIFHLIWASWDILSLFSVVYIGIYVGKKLVMSQKTSLIVINRIILFNQNFYLWLPPLWNACYQNMLINVQPIQKYLGYNDFVHVFVNKKL